MTDTTISPLRRRLLAAGATWPALGLATGAQAKAPPACPPADTGEPARVYGSKHYFHKQVDGQQVRLYMWRKQVRDRAQTRRKGIIVLDRKSVV